MWILAIYGGVGPIIIVSSREMIMNHSLDFIEMLVLYC
jgi:hypothetical protein